MFTATKRVNDTITYVRQLMSKDETIKNNPVVHEDIEEMFNCFKHYHNKKCKIYYFPHGSSHEFYIAFENMSNGVDFDLSHNDKVHVSKEIFNKKEAFNIVLDDCPYNLHVQNYKYEDVIELTLTIK